MTVKDYAHVSAVDPDTVRPIPDELPPFTLDYAPGFDPQQTFPTRVFTTIHLRYEVSMHDANRMVYLFGFPRGWRLADDDLIPLKAAYTAPDDANHGVVVWVGVSRGTTWTLQWLAGILHQLLIIHNTLNATVPGDQPMSFGEFLAGVITTLKSTSENVLLPRTHEALLTNSLVWYWHFLDVEWNLASQAVNPWNNEHTGGIAMLEAKCFGAEALSWQVCPERAIMERTAPGPQEPDKAWASRHPTPAALYRLGSLCTRLFEACNARYYIMAQEMTRSRDAAFDDLCDAMLPFLPTHLPGIIADNFHCAFAAPNPAFIAFLAALQNLAIVPGMKLEPFYVKLNDAFNVNVVRFLAARGISEITSVLELLTGDLGDVVMWALPYMEVHPYGFCVPRPGVFSDWFPEFHLLDRLTDFRRGEHNLAHTPASLLFVANMYYEAVSIIEWILTCLPDASFAPHVAILKSLIAVTMTSTTNEAPFVNQQVVIPGVGPALMYLSRGQGDQLARIYGHGTPFHQSGAVIDVEGVRVEVGEPFYYDDIANAFVALRPDIFTQLYTLAASTESITPKNWCAAFEYYRGVLLLNGITLDPDGEADLRRVVWCFVAQMAMALLPVGRMMGRGMPYHRIRSGRAGGDAPNHAAVLQRSHAGGSDGQPSGQDSTTQPGADGTVEQPNTLH
jgi:hypothetical protein